MRRLQHRIISVVEEQLLAWRFVGVLEADGERRAQEEIVSEQYCETSKNKMN